MKVKDEFIEEIFFRFQVTYGQSRFDRNDSKKENEI